MTQKGSEILACSSPASWKGSPELWNLGSPACPPGSPGMEFLLCSYGAQRGGTPGSLIYSKLQPPELTPSGLLVRFLFF